MPTYEFRCANGHAFDQFHKISDAPSTAICPVCGAVAERAISGGAGLVFKGSGFYLTDYGKNAHRTSGNPPAAKSEAGDGSANKSDAGAAKESPASSGGGSGDASASKSSNTAGSGGTSSAGGASGGSSTGGGSGGGASAGGGSTGAGS